MNLKTLTTSEPPPATAVYRPYYTEKNAITLKAVFDDLIANPRNAFIDASEEGIGVSTLQNRILYGLLWLVENSDPEGKYKKFKNEYSTKRTAGGVLIQQKNSVRMLVPAKLVAIASSEVQKSWLQVFTEWTTAAVDMEVFDSKERFGGKIEITNDGEAALVKLGAQLGLEMDISKETGSFKAMR